MDTQGALKAAQAEAEGKGEQLQQMLRGAFGVSDKELGQAESLARSGPVHKKVEIGKECIV